MNHDPFQLHLPNTFMGNGAVENVGELVKQLGGKKALIVTDTGIAEAGLVDHVKQSLEKKGIESGTFDGCKPDALIGVIKECAQFTAKGGFDLLIGVFFKTGFRLCGGPPPLRPAGELFRHLTWEPHL